MVLWSMRLEALVDGDRTGGEYLIRCVIVHLDDVPGKHIEFHAVATHISAKEVSESNFNGVMTRFELIVAGPPLRNMPDTVNRDICFEHVKEESNGGSPGRHLNTRLRLA
jgi:hypothetical protein